MCWMEVQAIVVHWGWGCCVPVYLCMSTSTRLKPNNTFKKISQYWGKMQKYFKQLNF